MPDETPEEREQAELAAHEAAAIGAEAGADEEPIPDSAYGEPDGEREDEESPSEP